MMRTAPLLNRSSMTPRPWRGAAAALRDALLLRAPAGAPPLAAPWTGAARQRRAALLAAVVCSAAAALAGLVAAQPPSLDDPLALAQIGLFTLLFAWVAAGFFTAGMGFLVLWRGDRHALRAERTPVDPAARTALIMPVCNEDISTVFRGLHATCASLAATGASKLFDVYLLSDSSDPAIRAAELRAFAALRDALGVETRVYYRWRRLRTKRKAGNVADFCRRWGADYRYMVVLDADSVMTGDCLVSLVRLMEANPNAGIVQTLPRASGHDTLHARAQAFLGQVAGRLFAAGLAYWQLGESHYWGHNAILRVAPFMQHCALAKLPGRGGLAGEILSHDFVEAALMRRAGHEVWLVDLPGSHEQAPPHLLDELKRDRRWCQGNLQNARLIAEPGFAGVHRAMFLTGALSYVASPLWLAFVAVGLARWALGGDAGSALPEVAPALWAATLAMLFLPRVLGLGCVLARGEARCFGGPVKLVVGSVLEAGLATLQAPVRMVAHTLFVLGALTGLKLEWKSPSRDAVDIGWREAMGRFGPGALAAVAALALLAPSQGAPIAVLPLLLPLVFAAPLAVWTSRVGPGAWLRMRGWLLVPGESRAPARLPHGSASPALVRHRRMRALRWVPAWTASALALLPIASLPGPAEHTVAFSYVAALPAPYEVKVALADSSGPSMRKVSTGAGKRRTPVKRLPSAI